MAVGKNKRLSKGSKKGGKKKVVDPFTKKDWYDIKALAVFKKRNIGKTLVTRTIGNKVAADGLKHRVFDVNQDDLNSDGVGHRKFTLVCEDVQGKNVVTNFHGMSLTRDKVCSMVKKWQTMIKADVEVKTTDGYTLRLFAVAFTKKQDRQEKKTTYAQSHQVKLIRKQMVDIIKKNVDGGDIVELIKKLLPDAIAADIQKSVEGIYPVENCHVSKVKVIKRPKLDLHRLAELHGDVGSKTNAKGEKVDRSGGYEPAVVDSV